MAGAVVPARPFGAHVLAHRLRGERKLRLVSRPRKSALLKGLVLPLALAAAALASPATSAATTASARPVASVTSVAAAAEPTSDNPFAGRPWGVYLGPGDQTWAPYLSSTGTQRDLLAKIALAPKAKWFGTWVSASEIESKVRGYIANAQAGDPNAVVQMTDFALKPWEHEACKRLPTAAQIASYKRWSDNFAAGMGDSPVAVILQPDGPFALCAPHHSQVLSHLIRYAAQRLAAHPNTSVYIEAGAADWLRSDPVRAARILVPAGVAGVRGFALNGTHYDSTANEIAFGTKVVRELARRGIPGKHFVINTSSNGKPFDGFAYTGPNFDNARVCGSPTDTACVTLGIPPTADVTNPRWGLSAANQARAARYVDAYLWFGRPWLYMQADPFVMKRALALVRTTPF